VIKGVHCLRVGLQTVNNVHASALYRTTQNRCRWIGLAHCETCIHNKTCIHSRFLPISSLYRRMFLRSSLPPCCLDQNLTSTGSQTLHCSVSPPSSFLPVLCPYLPPFHPPTFPPLILPSIFPPSADPSLRCGSPSPLHPFTPSLFSLPTSPFLPHTIFHHSSQ